MRALLLPAALLLTSPALAGPGYDQCVAAIDRAGFVVSQTLDCATKDMDRADAALNEAYRDTMARLRPVRRAALRDEERRWIDRRHTTCALAKQPEIPSRDINRLLCLVRATDKRTEEVKAYR